MDNLATVTDVPKKYDEHGPIRRDEVIPGDEKHAAKYTDSAAIKLITQDTAKAEQWLDQKQWAMHWRETDILYQSPRVLTSWENATTTRSNVSRFTVAKHVNALVPMMKSGIFYEDPPFVLRPNPGTTQDTVRAKAALFSAVLRDIEFATEAEKGMEGQCLNGTGIFKWGWTVTKKVKKKFIRKNAPLRVVLPFAKKDKQIHTQESDDYEVKEIEITESRPFLEAKELGQVFPAPGWRHGNQIWKAKYVVERNYVTFNDLKDLRQQQGYDIPDDETLLALFFPMPKVTPEAPSMVEKQQQGNAFIHHAEGRDQADTVDPLEQPLELLERWTKTTVMVALQLNGHHVIIRNEEHGLGRIPYLSCNWWNIQNAGYGLGVGRLIGSDQRLEQGSVNAACDIMSMAVNQQYARNRGANVSAQQIRTKLGGIIDVDGDPEKAFRIIEPPKVPADVWNVVQNSKQSSESTSGADEAMTQGSIPGRGSSIVRTATGAAGVAAANASRIQGPVGRFVDNVFIPFLCIMDEMINERMPIGEIRQIIGDELGEAFELDMDNFLNASLKYEVLAGAHLAAKKAMAQSLPLMVQILENPHLVQQLNATGYTVDVKELFDMFMEMSEWKNTRQVVRRMTQQEQALFEKFNATLAKVQGDLTKQNNKYQNDSKLVDQKREGEIAKDLLLDSSERATGYVERQAFERASLPLALTGEAGGDLNG